MSRRDCRGYCSCKDCPQPAKGERLYTRIGGRLQGEEMEPIVMDGFWERVRAFSELRDLDRRTRG